MDRANGTPDAWSRPLLVAWVSWLLGPAGFVFCAMLNDGRPDCFLASVAVAGHGAALILTVAMAGSARFRRLPEFWCMLTYWVPLAFMFLAMAIDSFQLGRGSMHTVMSWAALVPLAALVRLARLLGMRLSGLTR